MNKILIKIGPLTIYWYSFLIIISLIIGINIANKYVYKLNMPSSTINDLIVGLTISSILGARAYYVIFNYKLYNNPIDILKIWEGGLAIYGAIIAGIIYLLYYCHKKKLSFIKMLDICSLSLILGQAIGRWGNFFNKEAYGRITTYSQLKNNHIPNFIIKGMYINGAYRVPTFLYESIWCLIGALIIYKIRKKPSVKDGKQISFYFLWYGIGRFYIEGMRTDSLYLGNFRISQIISVILIIVGLIWNIIIYIQTHQPIKENTITGGNDGRI